MKSSLIQKNWRRMKKILPVLILFALLLGQCAWFIHVGVASVSKPYRFSHAGEMPKGDAIIILGALPYSSILNDRLKIGYELYRLGKAPKIIVTGDNSRDTYNEPLYMYNFLVEKGVPSKAIFMDYAGFDTYDSLVRAKKIFEVQTPLIVTQDFHLPRALYIARNIGLEAYGLTADLQNYGNNNLRYWQLREVVATAKAWLDVQLGSMPTYLGDTIPISGSGDVTRR